MVCIRATLQDPAEVEKTNKSCYDESNKMLRVKGSEALQNEPRLLKTDILPRKSVDCTVLFSTHSPVLDRSDLTNLGGVYPPLVFTDTAGGSLHCLV